MIERSIEEKGKVEADEVVRLVIFNVNKEDYYDFIAYTKKHAGNKGFIALKQLLMHAKINELKEENKELKNKTENKKEIKTLGKKKEVEEK